MLPCTKKICPMCEGSGYLNQKMEGENSMAKICKDNPQACKMDARNVTLFPNIAGGDHWNRSISKNQANSDRLEITADYVKKLDQDFFEDSQKFSNVQDTLKFILQMLKLDNWESNISALSKVVHISRIQPEIIDSSMPLITRTLNRLMKNVRPHVVKTACQMAEELFKTMQCAQKPEFDELVSTLLTKTSHMNKGVREDANKALDAMILYIPAPHCISVMSSSSGAGHKNPIVRTTVSRLMCNVVRSVGVETLLTASALKDSRRKTFLMCIEFLNDANTETRSNGRRLMQLLMRHSDFDLILGQEVDRALIKKVEKQLVALKYEEHSVE